MPEHSLQNCDQSSKEWPTLPVELNHLEAMGICMALAAEEHRYGLSEPQLSALDKLQPVLSDLLDEIGRPR